MKRTIQPKVQGGTEVQADGMGPSVVVVVSQAANDPGGWVVEVRANLAGKGADAAASYTIARLIVPPRPPGSNADRAIFVGSVPGALHWSAMVTPPRPAPPDDLVVDLFCTDANAQILPMNGATISP